MAFDEHPSQEMELHHFTNHHLTDNTGVLRRILPEQLNPSLLDGAGAPTWLSRQQSLHCGGEDAVVREEIADQEEEIRQRACDDGGEWRKCKTDILAHPLYEQLLLAHVQCLRVATPVEQLPRIDSQLAQSQLVVAKYSVIGQDHQPLDDKDLDQFMTHYVLLLSSFKEQLQQHVRIHATEAVMACWDLEQSLQSLTGLAAGGGTGATMSDDDDDQPDNDTNLFVGTLDGPDSMGFGPLVPTEIERSLIERVRQELKHELKQEYKEKIADVREEILRKRRAGKLPGDTTSLLKAWWQSHSKWPYPTEEDKARLVRETGLQLKQINNWFINQRKRNWQSNSSSSAAPKSKRKRGDQQPLYDSKPKFWPQLVGISATKETRMKAYSEDRVEIAACFETSTLPVKGEKKGHGLANEASA